MEDPFHDNVWFDGPPGWDTVRRYARMAASSVRNIHKEALLAKGWWKAEIQARKEREAEEGVVLSQMEAEFRGSQNGADFAEHDGYWEHNKR